MVAAAVVFPCGGLQMVAVGEPVKVVGSFAAEVRCPETYLFGRSRRIEERSDYTLVTSLLID